ncbi:MAG TPA: 2Fe-2S iron-sulfur cluster-binding protein [Caldimonas sp.]|jgi:adenylate cyclase
MRRDLRLASGLVLFTYVAAHLLNHTLGLVSVAVAERGLKVTLALWHSLPGTLVLYGAAGIHLALAFDAIYSRRTLRMAPLDMLRIVLGLGIPTLLIGHAVGTRLAWELYQQSPQYARVVWALWTSDGQGRQLALLVPGWLHGCLGVHLAFAQRPLYQRAHRWLLAAALMLPVLGGLGFLAMGRELAADLPNRPRLDAAVALRPESGAVLIGVREVLLTVYFSAIAAVFAAREIRGLLERRSQALIRIEYPQRAVRVPRGWSVLEASRSHHLGHLSLCGGRARCSTCRVRVTQGEDRCPPPGPQEQATLARIHAGPGVRLACQLRPQGDIAIVPLLGPRHQGSDRARTSTAVEQDIALVWVDWRNRAAISPRLLPQDAVFLSKLFSDTVALAVDTAGGTECDPSAGSTVAAFGIGVDLPVACRNALSAAHCIDRALASLADRWKSEFGVVPDFALCIHVGPAAIGEVGTGTSRRFTAAGPLVDTAQRLRAAAARSAAHILVSVDVLERAGAEPAALAGLDIERVDGVASLPVVELPSLDPVNALLVAWPTTSRLEAPSAQLRHDH